jgi:predicted house-cleaning noncanonical NTP pyrophosphatase (MazG superfamily)
MKKDYISQKTLHKLQEEYNKFVTLRRESFLEFMKNESSNDAWLKFKNVRDNIPELYRKYYNHPVCQEWRISAISGILQEMVQ